MWRSGVLAALVFAALGCAEDEPPPYGYLNLSLTGTAPDERPLRGMVVWADHRPGNRGVAISDDRALGAEPFALAVQPLALAEASENPIDGPIARGNLVAYIDSDDDGEFDFTGTDADGFRDRVVGWLPGVRFVYTPRPTPQSTYQSGVTIERSTAADFGTSLEIVPFDSTLELHLLDVEETACLGMSPIPSAVPWQVRDALSRLDPVPGTWWPYPVGAPPCAGGTLPTDWFTVDCLPEPGTYRVTSLEWPASAAIAESCGWSATYCTLTLDSGAQVPPEFPRCE